jgi:SanA protein
MPNGNWPGLENINNTSMKKYILSIIWLILLWIMTLFAINAYVLSYSQVGYYTITDNDVPSITTGLVFWAAVWGNAGPSDILKDRLDTAYQAYEWGIIQKIILSGDNWIQSYNEPVAMQKYLLTQWVDVHDMYLDYAGFDTYDSLYRAKHVFQVSELMLFTQDFHLKRAMYISQRLGISTIGVATNLQPYVNEQYNNRREVLARVKAFLDVEILKSKSKYLWDPIPILSDQDISSAKQEILEK